MLGQENPSVRRYIKHGRTGQVCGHHRMCAGTHVRTFALRSSNVLLDQYDTSLVPFYETLFAGEVDACVQLVVLYLNSLARVRLCLLSMRRSRWLEEVASHTTQRCETSSLDGDVRHICLSITHRYLRWLTRTTDI